MSHPPFGRDLANDLAITAVAAWVPLYLLVRKQLAYMLETPYGTSIGSTGASSADRQFFRRRTREWLRALRATRNIDGSGLESALPETMSRWWACHLRV